MSKRVVFKDGHVEEITKFADLSDGMTEYCNFIDGISFKVNIDFSATVNIYVFVTISGIYLCIMCPDDGYAIRSYQLNESGRFDEINTIERLELKGTNEPKPARPSVDDYYLNIAKAVCKRSTCMRRHYGAVIVKNGEIISTGYNGSPRGEDNCCDTGVCGREGNAHNDGDYRKCPAVHAEMNALLSAARKDTIGATLYLYGEDADGSVIDASPCPICDALIHNSGIENIVASNANWSCD